MEYMIGEIFEHKGEWYQCLKSDGYCNNCAGYGKSNIFCNSVGGCAGKIFKKIHKIGNPFYSRCPDGRIIHFQRYECYQKPMIDENIIWHWADDTLIDLEIKQNKEDMNKEELRTIHGKTVKRIKGNCFDCCFYSKGMCELTMKEAEARNCGMGMIYVGVKQTKEDMEEKTIKIKKEDIKVGNKAICLSNNKPYFITETNCRMKYDGDWHDCVIYTPLYDNPYKCFVRPIEDFAQNFMLDSAEEKEEKHSNLESTGKNLKPFDLQKAKEGKPVCTRDGRNVRILGFDAKGRKPISALVESRDGKDEEIVSYTNEGKFYIDCTWSNDLDLVMCQEKGMWVARDRDGSLHGYDEMPYKDEKNGNWYGYGKCRSVRILIWDMPEVRWEDEKPKKLIIK